MNAILPVTRAAIVRPVVCVPNPMLAMKSHAVEAVDQDIRDLAGDMVETMRETRVLGLSAVQIGVTQRVIVLRIGDGPRPFLALVNPEITWRSSDGAVLSEGCLSMPGQFFPVIRSRTAGVKFLDIHGAAHQLEFQGMAARALQHEVDHLDGVLISERAAPLNRHQRRMLEAGVQPRVVSGRVH